MLFLFHSVTGEEITEPTMTVPYSRFYPDCEVLDTIHVNHALFREMAHWIGDHGGKAQLEFVLTAPSNIDAILVHVPDSLAAHFKLRWC